MMMLRVFLVGSLVFSSYLSVAAAETAKCTVTQISAHKTATQGEMMDKKIGKELAKSLKSPMFQAWNRFDLQAQTTQSVASGKTTKVGLKDGGTLKLLVANMTKGIAAVKSRRITVTVTRENKKKKRLYETKVSLTRGKPIFIGGDKADRSGRFIALACK